MTLHPTLLCEHVVLFSLSPAPHRPLLHFAPPLKAGPPIAPLKLPRSKESPPLGLLGTCLLGWPASASLGEQDGY